MSGSGDNNKNGSSGRGAGNQSNQPLGSEARVKSNHRKETGGKRSQPDQRSKDQSSDRNRSV